MKYQKTLAVLAGLTFAGALSQAQIAVGDNLTISGFVDASYSDVEAGTAGADDATGINVDEVEIDFAFSFDAVSAEVHLESKGDTVALEQAFVSTDLGGITVSAGRMLNLLGFEADEPTGLLTYSNAYSDAFNPGSRYNDGIRGAFSQGDLSVAASVTDDYSSVGNDNNDADELAFDIALTYAGIENLSLSLGYADNSGDTAATDLQITNVHASYSLGQLTIGGEYSDWEDGPTEADAYLLLANYAVNDDLSITIRHSEVDIDGGTTSDREKTTVAAGYTVTDNLSTIIEYSNGEVDDEDNNVFAVEGIFTF
ncbi:MAG: outer membrane beta-barrel protein [Opitutae bacterium]|nr:outer membrane beta-barrel protein [Opitutae bacterium]